MRPGEAEAGCQKLRPSQKVHTCKEAGRGLRRYLGGRLRSSKRQKMMEIPLVPVRCLRYCVGHGSGENAGVWCPRSDCWEGM